VPVIDLRDKPHSIREMEAQRLAAEEALTPFDLSKGPLLRIKLLRLANMDQLLLLTLHHIVSDAWSMGLLWRELSQLYQSFAVGKQSPLDDLPVQYADYAHWQRELLSGSELQRLLSYWSERLEGAPPILELPSDRARPAVQRFYGAVESFELSRQLS